MDEYDRKFAEMQKYIPFLEAMIDRLQNVKDKSRETQLQKMQSLHGILSNSKRKLKIDTLQRCEDVLQKLHNKVEQGNTPGLHMRGRRSGRRSSRRGNSTDDVNINNSRETDKEKDKTMEETPASPSPPVSPDAVPQCAPIIIPTERNDDFPEDKCDDKGFDPEETEVLTIKEPIIIPTERQEDKSPINNANEQYPEWNMLEESENALNKLNWQSSSIGNQMVDVAGIVKLVCESLPQKTSESLHAPSHSRHITTIPVPSLGGSRRLTSVLEKSRLSGLNVDLMNDPRSESPAAVSDNRLKSPDSDVVNSRNKITSPMSKDLPTTKPKPPTSLLVSPPPVLTEPPLSMEDLAELLNEGENEKKSNDQGNEKNVQKSDDTLSKKDSKTPKNFVLSHPEIDHDNERRWEEVDKHIVKFTNKKVAPTIVSSIVLNPKTTDPKTQISPSTSKSETRFTDNYEKHVKPTDRAPVIQFRGSDEFHEDRSTPLFQRRGAQAINPMETDFRRETANDYYNWQQMQHPINANEFSKSTWVPPYSGPANPSMPNTPPVHSGQHPMGMHQDMWDMGLNHNTAPENHMMSDTFRSNQFSPNSGIIPLISPTNRSQDLNQMQNSNIPANNIPLINAPIMSPSHYPVVGQFRNFQENLPYETNFDRSEFSHGRQMWDPSSRVSDIPYRENESSHNISCESTSVHPQSNVPSLWGRHYGEQRVRNRESYDRSRNEFRNTFNRDGRRSEWSRDNYDWDNTRFNRDNRNFSDRDPRLRNEHVVPIPPHNQPKENNTNRDPRLAKDKHVPINKSKESKEIKDSKDPKDPKDSKVIKDSTDSKDSKEVRNFKDAKESKDSKDSKASKDSKESKESKDENERDTKKRHFAFKKKPKEFNKLHKNFHKRDFDPKQNNEKSKIDKVLDKEKDRCDEMRSPLESLYGVIDTKAKSVQGSGLQKFKIPKIKRPGPAPSPSVNTTSNETRRRDFKKSDRRNKSKNRFEKNEVIAEVTSTSDSGNVLKANANTEERWDLDDDIVSSVTIENPQKSIDINEPDSISNISASPENISGEKKDSKESEENKQKEEVTQEWIEALIRKSLQSGEGKKLIEQAQMFRRIGKALKTNKLKKIKKIIESESESSSSEKDVTEAKKLITKKKRRVIVSDSSEDECLADRLNTLKSLKSKNKIKSSAKNTISSDSANNSVTENKSASSMNIDLSNTNTEVSKENETSTKEITTDKRDESKDDETAESKTALSKSNRAKMKRRNSLEMLQEDVREMFICEDVVNATGHRQCRQVKEHQPNTNSNLNVVTSTPIPKKKELDSDKAVESIEKSTISTKSKVKTSKSVTSDDAKSKAKGKTAKRNTKQKSKDAFTSSDSEEDQPLALRSELLMEDVDTSTETSELKQNSSDSLRRSKRVQEKEAVKEPRVLLEKTEINKIDSKMMFDSSSDESFGIDVSELAAAVDISLHPEKQTEVESKQAAEAPKKMPQATKKKSRKGKGVTLHEEKVDDNASFTDDASITSDISLSSSNASGKKSIANKSKTNTNEELLSNILVGLVASKQDKNISGDKGSDADIDDDINDSLANDSNKKKPSVKKKKKKSSWQMGILSKKKKKKPVTPAESAQTTEAEKTIEVEKTTESTSKEDSTSSDNKETEIKAEEESKNSNEEQSYIESEKGNNDSVDKIESSMSFFEETEDKKNLHDLTIEQNNQNSTESKKANKSPEKKKFVDDIEKLISNMGPKQLMEYAWVGQQKYTCLLCLFVGKNIVHHYKVNHAGKEIMISRLKALDAESAVNEINVVKNEDLLDFETIKLNCRFCLFSLDGKIESTLEAFYEHLTTHTGEYRFRCRSCSYESVARASMKTHYYKVCRKLNQTFADSIFEDPIPKENSVYGYLCTACNFVQLKMDHVQLHLNNWHKDNADVRIVKINMSKNTEITAKSSVSNQNELLLSESSDVKKEEEPQEQESIEIVHQSLEDMETQETKVETVEHKWDPTKTEEQLENCINLKRRMSNNSEPIIRERKQTKRQHKLLTSETEVSVLSGNINAFVCPPELEHKEVEIQLERKKKMQEIIDDIGIKLQKDASARRLSIIDKLKDKMNSDLAETIEIEEFSATPVASTSAATESSDDDKKPSSMNIEDVKLTAISEILSTASLDQHKLEPSQTLEVPPKQEAAESDKTLMEVESELDASDNENVVEAVPNYESDSSSEQSESESTDVNMILKETSNINATSKDPMLTTIQRLAAQLQNVKHEKNSPSSTTEIKKEVASPKLTIPKPPSAIPIADIKNLMGVFDNKNQPKNFIRLRRLSGDMLSVPTVADQDDTPSSSCGGSQSDILGDVLQTDTEEECSFLKIENVVSLAPNATNNETDSPIINDIRKAVETSPTKNMSLLKANSSPVYWKRISPSVVAQAFAKKGLQSIPPVPEAVKLISVSNLSTVTNPQVATNYVPIVPKPNITAVQLDTKKQAIISNAPTITTTGSLSPILSSSLNYKIVKVVKKPSIIKPKENQGGNVAMKLKSSEAYMEMLKPWKLIRLYKCMSRDCSYSSNSVQNFHQHYLNHVVEYEKKNMNPPHDYQKCPYCYMIFENLMQFTTHIQEKHAHCRYQCNYCFYRAIAQSYVKIHQKNNHPGSVVCILTGKNAKAAPIIEIINRRELILPFVCQHECGRSFYVPETFANHLKSHGPQLYTFKCHICEVTFLTGDRLIGHYKMHGMYKYQCLYCLNGSDSIEEIHKHLSLLHCNRLPQILERSLPTKDVGSSDVIDKLLVKNLEELCPPEAVVEIDSELDENESSDIEKAIQSFNLLSSTILNDVSSANIEKINTPAKSFLNASTSSNPGKESEKEDLSPIKPIEASMETSLKANKDLKDNDTSQLNLHKSELQLSYKEADTKDPLTTSENINYTDEFVNINILDNPDFLKNINQFYNLSYPKSNLCSNDKNSDSDIEILENIEYAYKDSAELSKIKVDDKLETQIDKDNEDDSNAEITKEIEKIENSPICSKQESSDLSNEENSLKKLINYPLTLEDIKDTGFSGEDLYKCGNEHCTFKSPNATLLRAHLKECSHNENKNISCAHCGKRFLKVGFLLEHLKIHGIKRFGCSLCDNRFSLSYQAISHIKSRHKFISHKLIPADPKNPSADGLFIIQPDKSIEDKKRKKKKAKLDDKISEKKEDVEKSSFSPDEIEQLPRQAIYNREVQCAVCPYTTKVRTNIIRHLQLHAKDETVPESGPVNPVPCLDKKERMFDKMVNLASSSHQNGRMGAKPKEPVVNIIEEDTIPKFVPEHKRYVCGVAECNYLTVDEAMLRYHLKALHSEEPYFRCPHCPSPTPGQEGQNIAIDKMGIHLKMHDARLYKCSHCNHHHYHRHVVERHLADKHPEKRPYVKVIRELENTENIQQFPERDENEEEVPDPDGNHWKCNICDYKCVYKAEMVSHISTSHDEKCQFKCTLCPFKTSGKIIFDQHISSKHADNANADYIIVYQRIKGVNKKPAENVEPIVQDEPFDTTPLWRRDMPRIRHIRGILLEDENITSETSKSNKRKMEDQGSGKPAKIKASKSASLDENKQCKEKSKRSLSCDKMPEVFKTDEKEKVQDSNTAATQSSDKESDVGKFGPYGKPNGNMYTCTLCNQFKTKYKHDMRDHLYRELNYTRWHCSDCGYLSVSRNALLKHCTKRHDGEIQNQKPLSPNTAIEEWVSTLLAKQTSILKLMNQSAQSPQKTSSVKSSSPFKSPIKSPKLGALSLQENKIANIKLDLEKLEDYESKEDDELIMDLPEEELTDESGKGSTSTISKDEQEKSLECKHCSMKFTSWRGFKLHVQITHLKRLGFLCPYCDRSTNSEHLMRQHIKSKHSGQPEIIVHNPAAGGPELTNEFWEKEYGIICPKRTRKRKRKQSLSEIREDNSDAIKEEDTTEKCTICGFAALSPGGLKAHMRIHIVKDLGCTQCAYSTSSKAELYEHWEQNHPHLLLKEEVTAVPKKSHLEDYSNDIEVEIIQSTSSSEVENKLFYNCFYCNLRSERLHILEQHWRITHQKSDLPFKYKKVQVPFPKLIKPDDNNALRAYMQSSVANKNNQQVGWMCQWCKEFCDSEIKINSHHNMFHSHLPPKFKKIGSEVGNTPNLFICKYCDKPFKSAGLLISHNTKEHPGNELRLFAQNLNSEIENATGKEARSTVGETAKAKNEMRRVARKSTTKSNIKYKFKSVARKSTNSLPRYQVNKFKVDKKVEIDAISNDDDDNDDDNDDDDDNDNNKQFSFYGKPIDKVNLAKLNTYMVIGGHRMKVNCTTLTQFMNIHPKLKIPDLKYDAQYAAVLKMI